MIFLKLRSSYRNCDSIVKLFTTDASDMRAVMERSRIIIKEHGNERNIILDDRARWTFGRKAGKWEPDISVSAAYVSRMHGEFCCINGVWMYFDRGSSNGTYVNGRILKPGIGGSVRPHVLQNGDVLCVDISAPESLESEDISEEGLWIKYLECEDDC